MFSIFSKINNIFSLYQNISIQGAFFISARAMNLNILRFLKVHIQQNIEYPQNGSEVAKTI